MSAIPFWPELNLIAAWVGILLGMLGGAVVGLFFHRAEFMGGYGDWRRRLMRLGHVSFFGLAFVNLAFVVTAERLGARDVLGGGAEAPFVLGVASWLLVAGAVLMPAVCFAAAWRKPCRNLFFLPVGAEVVGVACVIVAVVSAWSPGNGGVL